MMIDTRIIRMCLPTERARGSTVPARRFWPTRAAGRTRVSVSVVIEHPILREPEVERSEGGDHDEQEPRHRRGVAHVELREGLFVQQEREEHRRVARTARA